MPEIDASGERLPFKFKGKSVNVPVHFKTGHVMSENDAKFGNRQLASVLGNVLVSALNRLVDKKAKDNAALADTDTAKQKNPDGSPKIFTLEDVTDTEVQSMFDAIFSNYEIGVNNNRGDGSGVVHDPATAIANNIAWERIKVLLKGRNIKVGSVKAEKKTELVADMLKRDPSILELAKAQVGASTPTDGLDALFAGLPVGTAAEQSAGADTTPAPVPSETVSGTAGTDTIAGTDTPAGTDTVSGEVAPDSVTSGAGNDTVTAPDTTAAPAVEGGVIGSEPAPDLGVPPSEPSSTAEIGGATAVDAGVSPANPGTLASPQPEEGTGQGPTDDAGPQTTAGGAFA